LFGLAKKSVPMKASFADLKEWLLEI